MGSDVVLYALALVFPLAVLFQHFTDTDSAPESKSSSSQEKKTTMTTIMPPERVDLPPPKDDPFTQESLKAFDGTDSTKPVYVAIKGAPCAPAHPWPFTDMAWRPTQVLCSTYRGSVRRTGRAGHTRCSQARTRPARWGCRA